MAGHVITRESLADGWVQRMASNANAGFVPMTLEELAASRAATMAARPPTDDKGVWIFGYGSLIWNPAFHVERRAIATVHGWHRRFCLWTHLGRGSPEQPGLVLGLDRGGQTRGVALRIAPELVDEEMGLVWRREMVGNAYAPRWVPVVTDEGRFHAIAFTINREHPRYVKGLSDEETARVIAVACGRLGPCAEYLVNTVDHLAELGIPDRHLTRLKRLMHAHLATMGV